MARIAIGRGSCIHSPDVAVRAWNVNMSSSQRKCSIVVIEYGRAPGCRIVADRAVLRETGRNVIGISRAVEICKMARNARGRQARIYAVAVARRTLQRDMSARERKGRVIVIESCAAP